ncbi:MAG TPA: SIS domain-containing protein [Atribacteraceae bacterium]|nr:SIS domain-containing protein [Atribacteraceae bacterium]
MNTEFETYFSVVNGIFSRIKQQEETFGKAARLAAAAIAGDELLHIIGSGGHSSMAAEEIFWRSGGLAPVNALLDPGIALVHGARRTNIIERTTGYAQRVLDSYGLGQKPGEVLIIANAYGINAMSIDCAVEARARGMVTIGITSTEFATRLPKDHPSRHPSGKNLYEEVDVFLDCCLPFGDAAIKLAGCAQSVGPTSTLCNVFTLNLLIIETVKQLVAMGIEPPLWTSANMPGGDEANRKHFQKYIPRIKHLA